MNNTRFSSVAQLCPTRYDSMDCSMPGFPVHHQLWELAQTHVHQVSDAIQSSHSVLSPSPPAFSVSQMSALHIRWPKYWSFSFSISPSNEHSGLISFRIDWFDFLAVQGTSPAPQFKSINSSILSLPYSPTLTSIHDYWENHSFECMDLHWQSGISSF